MTSTGELETLKRDNKQLKTLNKVVDLTLKTDCDETRVL